MNHVAFDIPVLKLADHSLEESVYRNSSRIYSVSKCSRSLKNAVANTSGTKMLPRRFMAPVSRQQLIKCPNFTSVFVKSVCNLLRRPRASAMEHNQLNNIDTFIPFRYVLAGGKQILKGIHHIHNDSKYPLLQL